ncbi:MAG: hypothetical protein JWM14_2991 [Chitinophagaceae bacterium]|nr:hypothetical protein [Chitinophagaceae bacterium]
MKSFFLNVYEKLHTTLLAPAIIGVLVFGLFFDWSIVEPTNIAWLLRDGGDSVQHYLGSFAFRSDTWHFPLTKTVLVTHPEGVSIVFTDSNPLLSIIAKCIKFIFPPYYQFFGFWLLLCWILQSVLGYLLIKKLTGNKHYALLSAVLFCLLPTQLHRIGHANLVAFWTILWALYVFINDDFSRNKKQWLFFLIFSLSALIHPYLLFMVLFIGGTWYCIEIIQFIKARDYQKTFRFVGINALYGIALGLIFWVAGYFYNIGPVEGMNGFGYYSMNLNGPFNDIGDRFSYFMNPFPREGGQYEGYQYLGFGVLVLFALITWYGIKKEKPYLVPFGLFYATVCLLFLLVKHDTISFYEKVLVSFFFIFYGSIGYLLYKEKQTSLVYLYIPATLCFLYALSNKVMLGNTVLYEYFPNNDAFYIFFLQSARSSGRFFWVTLLFLLVGGLFLLHRYFGKDNKSMLLLALIIFIQYLDIPNKGFIIASNNKDYESPLDASSKEQILASKTIHFLSGFDMKIAEFSLLNQKMLNKFYIAHEPSSVTVKRLEEELQQLKGKKQNPQDLYLIGSSSDLPLNVPLNVYNFFGGYLSVTPTDYHSKTSKSIWINHKESDSLSTLIRQIKTSPLVLIAVKDEAFGLLPDFFKQQLDSLYKSKLTNIAFRDSYLAVFSYGKLITESLGKGHALEYKESLLNHEIFLKSAGYDCGNEAIVSVDGTNLSTKSTGFNVLVLEEKGEIWNAYNYNTFGKTYTY